MTIDDKKATNEIIEPYPNLISGALNHIRRFKNKIVIIKRLIFLVLKLLIFFLKK
tara:strand:+ start:404 stop:568 length:165 start_codon:yes stop_codon:yes gene_type:complete